MNRLENLVLKHSNGTAIVHGDSWEGGTPAEEMQRLKSGALVTIGAAIDIEEGSELDPGEEPTQSQLQARSSIIHSVPLRILHKGIDKTVLTLDVARVSIARSEGEFTLLDNSVSSSGYSSSRW